MYFTHAHVSFGIIDITLKYALIVLYIYDVCHKNCTICVIIIADVITKSNTKL